ncbi:thiol reductant ABC exporter subunit CydD [Okibacterium fritillariae]|uniref:ATP-binding cassette, subfamily C, CydD n=1 Tax=Okibacterium fritillariae TaxID=123320 RepID=A0A1T5JB53_9MICO|nr:thiol reductant ABC exporter subunit CydD [Okibacterium fritillariae]SKC48645.1 ATP-binding cassette, subfamily C, CydD [Okibacterium fritillariae]
MKPLDPRLLRYAKSARLFLVAGGAVGLATTGCIVAFAFLLTTLITRAIDGAPLDTLWPFLGALVAVILVRAVLVWANDALSARAAARVKGELRTQIVDATTTLGPAWMSGRSSSDIATLAGRGVDALDDYFSKYIPQLLLTAIATPVIVLSMFVTDWLSAVIVIVTLPLIPVFMILIGWATQAVQQRQWQALGRLSRGFVDTLGGLATLKIFGRQNRQVERMSRITREYRVETMKVLRVSFLSSFALELAASLSVAIVAVSVGLRLVDGSMLLPAGLFVLLLAPEAFLPIRQVGANFHAAAEGVTAADEAFAILDEARARRAGQGAKPAPVASSGEPVASSLRRAEADPSAPTAPVAAGLAVSGLSVSYGDDVVVQEFSARFEAGSLTVLSGPSGSGKSTIVAALNGFVPAVGRIAVDGRDVASDRSVDDRAWLAWAGQKPGLIFGTVAENVALGDAQPDEPLVRRSLERAAIADLDPRQELGVGGSGVSGGQAQRVAIARALYRLESRGCRVLVLDEPSSALDHATEARLIARLREVARAGVAVIVVSHRQAFLSAADAVVTIAPVSAAGATARARTRATTGAPRGVER